MIQRDPHPSSFNNGLFLRNLAILSTGFVAGMVAAYLFAGIHFDFSQELDQARQLGIVSLTILAGYAKKRDILNYLAMIGFPNFFAVGGWLFWARDKKRREELATMFSANPVPLVKTRGWQIALTITVCVYLVFSFNINWFHASFYNDFTGDWPLLGEEGENLAWVHNLLNGGVYGKDIHCLYGPMLIYPLVWFMKLFGTTVVTARVYTYVLDLFAYSIILAFLYKTLRSKTVFISAAAYYILFFNQGLNHLLSPNSTYLRVALGFVPIFLTYSYQGHKTKVLVVAAGLVLGQSLLFSQEVGVCSMLAVFVLLFAMHRPQHNLADLGRDIFCLLAGIVVSVLPLLTYFWGHGVLDSVLNNLFVHPRLLGLGFTALPFPDLREFLQRPWELFLYYWAIFVYVASALYLIPLLIMGRRDRETLLRVSVLAFGAILFRAALARSDTYHVLFVSQPAFLLLFLFIDGALAGIGKNVAKAMVAVQLLFLSAMIGWLFLLSINNLDTNIWTRSRYDLKDFGTKLSILPYGLSVPQVPRAGILFDPTTANSVAKIASFINQHTQPSDYVYFFPNEAAYNFLFDRRNPTRYVISYFAVTRQQRLELIADLEKKRPEYVIYSKMTWRVDDIPENIQVPEVVNYLRNNYVQTEDLGDVLVLKRKSP